MAYRQTSLKTPSNGPDAGPPNGAPSSDDDASSPQRLLVRQPTGGPAGREIRRAPAPFVWQHGTRLLLLDDEPAGWVMAELRFETETCRYVEIRRATYRWPREAIGAVLSRALASGDHAAVDTALSLHDWLSTYYGIDVVPDLVVRADGEAIELPA
jgi:hypothetical protein